MQREQLYLQDILDACDMIQTFLAGLDAATFLASELHKAAILQKLTIIGEAAALLYTMGLNNPPRMIAGSSSDPSFVALSNSSR